MMRFIVAIALLATALGACTVGPYLPPPEPVPVPNPPEPGPAGTPCERAYAHSQELGCGYPPSFVDGCRKHGELADEGGQSGWNAACMVEASDCAALEDCRGGTR